MPFFGPYSATASATTESLPLPGPAPEVYHLFLLQPEIVFRAQVNLATPVYPLDEVPFDNVTIGAFGDVDVNMTVSFGSAAGLRDLGRQRVRALPTASVLPIGRSSQGTHDGEANLSDNVFLEVLDLYQVWARPPYLEVVGDVTTIWKDPGLLVEWRTTQTPPVCNIGCGFARTIDPDTGLITVAFPQTGSFSYATAPGATITAYLWDVKDGTIVTGTTTTETITVTFPAGFRYVKCTVTDSNGHAASMRVPVLAEDPANPLTIPFQFEGTHRIGQDGQRLSVRVLADIPTATYPNGTLAMIWRGEPADLFDRSHMTIIGWTQEEPASIEARPTATLRDVTLDILDVAGRLDTLPGFPQRVEDDSLRVAANTAAVAAGKAEPFPSITWSHMVGFNMDLYLLYLLGWHSTAPALADFYWSGTGAAYAATGLSSEGQSLWDQVAREAASLVPVHRLTCDQFGAIRVLPDPILQPVADRTAVVQASLTAADWSDIRYTQQRHPRAHWLEANAIVAGASIVAAAAADIAAGIKPTIPTVFSIAPGDAPGQGENAQDQGEQLALSQAALNDATGQQYARLNAPQSEFNLKLTNGDPRGIQPAWMTWVPLTIPASVAAQRGLAFTAARGLVKELSIRYVHRRTGLTREVDLTWERETSGPPGVTVVKPVGPAPADPAWPGDFHGYPPPPVVVPPYVPPFVPPLPLYTGQEVVCLCDEYGQLFRSWNFTSGGASPTWDRKTLAGLGGSEKVLSFVVDPFSPLYRVTGSAVNAFVATERYIYKVNDLFGATPTKTELYSFGYVTNPDLDRNRVIQASFGRFFSEETDNPWLVVVSHNGTLPDHEGTRVNYSTDGGQTWAGTGINGHSDSYTAEFREPWIGLYLSPKTPGLAYTAAYLPLDETDGFISTDWGATWTGIADPDIDPQDGLAGDIHVPFPDNADEKIVYHGRWQKGDPLIYRTYRVEGTSVFNISPSYDSRTWGVNRSHFAIRTYDNNRQYVALAGIANGATASFADDVFAAFVSGDHGATWTNIVATLAKTAPHPEAIAFAADTEQILYLWGTERYIGFSSDFGATIVDKSGNMPTDFATDIRDIVGIAGGEAPP